MQKGSMLEAERRHLERAVGPILQRYEDGEIDLDDIIEELRPVRMRLHAINCQLKEKTGNSKNTEEVKMEAQGFRKFLTEMEIPDDEVKASIELAEKFEDFISAAGRSTRVKGDVFAFSTQLIEQGANTQPNYYALARYGRFIGNDDVYVGVVELLDGGEAMGNLYQKIGEVLGEERRDVVFEGINLPSMGMPNRDKVVVNQQVMTSLEEVAGPGECDQVFADSLRDLEDAWYEDDKELYQECSGIDEFLDRSAQNFISQLEKIRDEGGLFFSQEITDEVVDFVKDDPLIARGAREGDILYEVKIPHQTVEFLNEDDAQKKRYYYCHCPWVKESLKNGGSEIPTRFCDCSAGFHKKRWEVIFDQPLEAEIVESVLKGDDRCKIAIHLPVGIGG